ncbi:MAG: peroxidase-related enzyme [Alphaproteobacteria bacterium]|nr:peroxidase-related enzyme [Alphaproteobacteria bacterium]
MLSQWQAAPATAAIPAIEDSTFVHPTQCPKPGEPVRVNGFTSEELGWRAWLPVLNPAQATDQQLGVLKASHPSAMTSDYYLLLAHQPVILEHRSAAFNAIMYAPGGLNRAERELASTVVSRVNGCVYCAAVHALRFEQLSKRNDVIAQVFEQPHGAGTTAREKALIQFAIDMTEQPEQLGATQAQAMADVGLSPLEMLDLIHAVAIFAWANRLMLNLGEPVYR